MNDSRSTFGSLPLALMTMVMAQATHAADGLRAVVARSDGTQVSGAIQRIDDEAIELADAKNDPLLVKWTECVGVAIGEEPGASPSGSGTLMLVDGQRLPGRAELNASGWRWWQPWLGVMESPPSTLRWLSFDGVPPPAPAADADVVLLRTGDRLEGFVSRVADPLPLEPRAGGAATLVPTNGIAAISFVAAETPGRTGHRRVWMRDGTVLDAKSLRLDGGGLLVIDGVAVEGIAAPLPVPLDRVAAISGDRPSRPLASGELTTVETPQGAELRYTTLPPQRLRWPDRRAERPALEDRSGLDASVWPFGAPAIAFDGPAILRVSIDAPATLCARVRLPRDRRPWGKFDLFVRSGGAEVARMAIDPSAPTHDLCVRVQPPAVEFEIVDTGGGAVQDGVVIEHGVLISAPSSVSTPAPRSDPPTSR